MLCELFVDVDVDVFFCVAIVVVARWVRRRRGEFVSKFV